eukprot:1149490-Pelagomonas_calceolata.AAC.8
MQPLPNDAPAMQRVLEGLLILTQGLVLLLGGRTRQEKSTFDEHLLRLSDVCREQQLHFQDQVAFAAGWPACAGIHIQSGLPAFLI